VDLGSFGGTPSEAYAINDAGQVVGFSQDALSRNRAFIWSEGVMQGLGTLGGQTSWAYSINNSGQVVGIAQTFQEKNLAFLWHNGSMQNLGIGTVSSRAEGINDSGSVVGGRNDEGIPQRAFLWTDGELTDLGTLGGSISFANDINNNYQIVGSSWNESGGTRPFIWENGVMRVLEQLGDSHGSANAINDAGQIVGFSGNRAFFWSNGNVQTLDMLGTSSDALGINDFGEIVGVYSDGGFRAFHWHNGNMRDLNDLIDPESGWHLSFARDINNAGSIVGHGTYLGQTRPFLLIPIPENIIYVDAGNGSDFHSGASWEYPLATLHRALEIAQPGHQIRVTAGTYTPTNDPTDRDASFVLKNGVSVYGGFSGSETSLSERDVTGNPTILSGDINGSGDLSGNSYHVVNAVGTSRSAVLDGFIITGGNANVEFDYPRNVGGGIHYDSGSPTLTNLIITWNNAIASGGGMFCLDGGSPVLTNVVLSNNSAGNLGGAISGGTRANPVFINVTVANNAASATGGLYFSGDIDATFTNVVVWGNENEQVRSHGTLRISHSLIQGGLANIAGDKSVIDNGGNVDSDPLFIHPGAGDFRLLPDSPAINGGTNAPFLPGGIRENVTTDLDGNQRIIHGTIDMGAYEWEYPGESIIYVNANAADNNDGTNWENAYVNMYSALWTVRVVGSALIDEIWVTGGTYKPTGDPSDRTQSFRLANGVAVYGGFTGTEEYVHQRDWISNPTILSGDINNSGDFNGNSYHVVYGSGVDDTAVLDGFIITGGNADGTGINGFGGGIRTNASGPLLSNLIIHGNRATGNQGGGGIFDSGSNGPLYLNVVVSGNRSAGNGGGITLSSGSSARFVNVTVSGNSAEGNGGGVYITSTGGNPRFTNAILWSNRADAEADELYVTSAEVTVSHSLIRGE
jgi:probable HAF family extracellular repeat protein